MSFVSVTRLRLRSWWFFPAFFWHSARSQSQAQRADGNLGTLVRPASGAFWTLTLWRDRAAMRAFMMTGPHKVAMPRLQHWCDEASVANWEQDGTTLPTWAEAERHLAQHGRVSAVKHPSPAHSAGHTLGSQKEPAP